MIVLKQWKQSLPEGRSVKVWPHVTSDIFYLPPPPMGAMVHNDTEYVK